jgi:hypothetical protein
MKTESKRQNRMSTVTPKKYTFFLNEVYRQIQDNKYVYMHSICCDFKIGRHIPTILKQENIVKSNGINKYIWIGKKPSLQMANLIIEKGRIYCDKTKYLIKETGQKEINFKTPVTKLIKKPSVKIVNPSTKLIEQKQNYSFSILWGLIKIQKS